jgi:hypothetical protein
MSVAVKGRVEDRRWSKLEEWLASPSMGDFFQEADENQKEVRL